MKGHKKLQDFFVDAKIPKYKRKQIPIIVHAKYGIIKVGNLRDSEDFQDLASKIKIEQKG